MMNVRRSFSFLLLLAAGFASAGCSNPASRRSQIWIWDDMKKQAKYKAQTRSPFFADGRASRLPVEGTIAQENPQPDTAYTTGRTGEGRYVTHNPEALDQATLALGQAKFDVYCTPCHDRTGGGRGIVPVKTNWPAADLRQGRVKALVDGELYDVVSQGRRSMPASRFQTSARQRWAIVGYLRMLQRGGDRAWRAVPAATPIGPGQ